MKILGRTLSIKAEVLFNYLMETITTKILFSLTKDQEHPAYIQILPNGETTIFISELFNDKEFENSLLHEIIHVWQKDNGFYNVFPNDINDRQTQVLSNMINSFILDMNVNYILDKYSIFSSKKFIQEKYEFLKDQNAKFSKAGIFKEMKKLDELGFMFQHCHIYISHNKPKGRYLISQVSVCYPQYQEHCQLIIDAIEKEDVATKEGMHNIMSNIIVGLHLESEFAIKDYS